MQLTRRSFVNKVVVGIASLPFMKGLSSAQVRGRLGYMKIVDNAAMFMAVEKGFFTAEGLELEPVPMAAGRIGFPVFETGLSEQDLQGTIDLTHKYKLIARPFKAREMMSELAPKV